MKTTKTIKNVKLAERLLELREELKLLNLEEKALKAHFSNIVNTDGSLLIGTACIISKHEQTRSSYDTSKLNAYFEANNLDMDTYKKSTTFDILKVQAI